MKKSDDYHKDIIDEDLYEEFEDEELLEIIEEERAKAMKRQREEKYKPKRPFPRWAFWLIAAAMLINVIAVLPQTFSIPAIDFLTASAKLSANEQVQEYKKAVVVIEAGESKGTGFSITSDGRIITNYHVVEEENNILAAYPEEGLFDVEVVETFPAIDLAVLQVEGEELPYLKLAEQTAFTAGEDIFFIGNPLKFQGIANKGEIIGYTKLDSWDQEVLMLEAPIYRGNSGSPVINQAGEVIGIVFATLNHKEEGRVGLAVPIDYYHQKQYMP